MYFKDYFIVAIPRYGFEINLFKPFIYDGEEYTANLGEINKVAHAYFGKNSSTIRNSLFSSIKNRGKKIMIEV